MSTKHYRSCSPWSGLPCSKVAQDRSFPLYITPPANGQIRVRRLVHRGAPRPAYKFWSLKLGRIVQCESVLEVEVAQLLDASPEVAEFSEQPAFINYEIAGQRHVHVPDFVVRTTDRREFIEVKYSYTVDDEVRRRTTLLVNRLAHFGWDYRLLTDAEINRGSWLSNARVLLRRGQESGSLPWSLQTYERVRQHGSIRLEDFGWSVSRNQQAAWIASELIRGRLWADRSMPITARTPVCLPGRSNTWRTLPW
ncbi:TnsA endonuclease N-terminal domain-containing protein [Marilutibacter maris]|uniref:TnsA endonuclease N-terminal domain-containing protein n=1 Tax=Marilutibacter maris TaxID=1605891 RepID=UPI000DA7D820|nr:TnsA endonuclease N-terminal domain-containing protein [Lysobacter maris]